MLKNRAKKRKKWIIPVVVAGVLTITALLTMGGKEEAPQLDLLDTTVLAYRDMEDSISATGVVESAHSMTVYSTMAYPVMAVHVEVGDYVEVGDLLAELDDKTIRNQISSQEINLETASQSGAQQVHTAQQNYSNFKSGLDQGLNATLNGARTQADTAYDNYIRAKNTYERYAESLNVGENTALLGAESALRGAEAAYDTARDVYEEALEARDLAHDALAEAETPLLDALHTLENLQTELELAELELEGLEDETLIREKQQEIFDLNAQILEQQVLIDGVLGMGGLQAAYDTALSYRDQANAAVVQAEKALDNAAITYETQKSTYNATVTTVDNTLADYLTAMDSAWETYQNALTSLASTEKTVNEQLQSYANNVTTAQIAAGSATLEESLRQLESSLEDAKITAPCSGTVTAVYAEVGGAGSGLLFIIEDVDDLVVATSVKGYDMGTVQEGMAVKIRSDATGDTPITGEISSIAPTADKTVTTGDATFAAEVTVLDKGTGLRIGMEAQLDYIIAEETHVLAVPYDAVYENDAGQTCVMIAVETEGKYAIEELPVTTGLDDDLDMVITGSGVKEGLRVIHAPDSYRDLLGQTVIAGTGLNHGLPFPIN